MGDSEFLKRLMISPWPEADDYKKERERMLNEFNNEFDYYDENPNESPFQDTYPDPEVSANDAQELTEEDIYRTAVVEDLITSVQEYLAFSTVEDLYKLIAKYI